MISGPEQVGQGGSWDGTSILEGGAEVDNLESSMDFAEHQRIVFEARHLLASFSQGAAVKWGTGKGDAECIVAFDDLKKCYEDTNSKHKLTITKGIHQPKTNPHMQLTLHEKGKIDKGRKFHLDVAATLLRSDLSGEEPHSFIWKPVKFTYVDNQKHHSWPENASAQIWKETWANVISGPNRQRRNSISLASHDERLAELEERRAAEEQARAEEVAARKRALEEANRKAGEAKLAEERRRAAEEARRKRDEAAHARGQQRAAILKAFTAQNMTFAKILKREKEALFEGGEVVVKDKNGRKGGKLVFDGEKITLG